MAPAPSVGRIAGAIAAALAVQFAALLALLLAFVIVLAAAFSVWDTDEPNPTWVVLAVPAGLAAIGLWIASGAVAARIARSRWGWMALLLLPVVLAVGRYLIAAS